MFIEVFVRYLWCLHAVFASFKTDLLEILSNNYQKTSNNRTGTDIANPCII